MANSYGTKGAKNMVEVDYSDRAKVLQMVTTIAASATCHTGNSVAYYDDLVKTLYATMAKLLTEGKA
jgi:hypothetical protein